MAQSKTTAPSTPKVPIADTLDDITQTRGIKYRWKIKNCDGDAVREIAYAHSLSIPIAQALFARGYQTKEQIRSFLFSSFEQDVPHASRLKGMDIAVKRILKAIEKKEKILIFGDYDVDGVTSSSVALTALIPLGADINFFLPNRKIDGYGLSKKAVVRAHQNNYKLIITVDNGISAYEAAEEAQKLGVDLIITDHHRPHDHVPPALAIINPNQADCMYPFKSLAGVGVTFKLMSMIYEVLGLGELPEKTYELLLLGTVADVVPLLGENRYWVRYGLAKINKHRSNSMRVLAQNTNLTKELYNSLDIGFMIAPQINALGRLSDPRDAVKFMISSNLPDVERVGLILKTMNEDRKKIERDIYDEIDRQIQSKQIDLEKDYVIVASSSNWPAGVIGLVAGKLMHNYGRPTLLFHIDSQGFAKGSCRSIPEFDIFDGLTASSDLLEQFGGHSFAAGLKLKASNLAALKDRMNARVASKISMQDLQPKAMLDAMLELPEVNQKLLDDLEQLEPFGNQNPQPLFWVKNVTLLKPPQVLKEKHIKCMIFDQGIIKPVVFFNRPDLLAVLDNLGDSPFHLAAHVMKNEWNGTVKIELQGIDIALI